MSAHLWSYRSPNGETRTDLPEADLVRRLFEGDLDPGGLVSSPTRSQGKWYRVRQVPSLLGAWRRGELNRQRAVRVYVCSAGDLAAELSHLHQSVFPVLRELCDAKNIAWETVDIRPSTADGPDLDSWITERFDAIDRCRPFFLGLLGQRYGAAPREVPAELLVRRPWLSASQNRSVTELEILHGALADPVASGDFARFYFRSASATHPPDASPEPEEAREKLQDLKHRLRVSRLAVRGSFQNVDELGSWVLRDFRELIERTFVDDQPQQRPVEDRLLAQHEHAASTNGQDPLARCEQLQQQSRACHARGELTQALQLYREEELIAREASLNEELRVSLGCQAAILADQGEFEQALAAHQKEEAVCREMDDRDGLAAVLGNQAFVLDSLNRPEDAVPRLREAELLLRELGDEDQLGICVRQLAMLSRAAGDLEAALSGYEEFERLSREHGDLSDTLIAIEQQSDVLMELERYEEASEVFEKLEELAVVTESARHQAMSYFGRGEISQKQSDLNGSLEYYMQAQDLFDHHKMPAELISTRFRIAEILYELYERDETLPAEPVGQYEMLEQLCVENDDPRGAAIAMMNRATILLREEETLPEAQTCIKRAIQFTSEHGLAPELESIQSIAVEIEQRMEG